MKSVHHLYTVINELAPAYFQDFPTKFKNVNATYAFIDTSSPDQLFWHCDTISSHFSQSIEFPPTQLIDAQSHVKKAQESLLGIVVWLRQCRTFLTTLLNFESFSLHQIQVRYDNLENAIAHCETCISIVHEGIELLKALETNTKALKKSFQIEKCQYFTLWKACYEKYQIFHDKHYTVLLIEKSKVYCQLPASKCDYFGWKALSLKLLAISGNSTTMHSSSLKQLDTCFQEVSDRLHYAYNNAHVWCQDIITTFKPIVKGTQQKCTQTITEMTPLLQGDEDRITNIQEEFNNCLLLLTKAKDLITIVLTYLGDNVPLIVSGNVENMPDINCITSINVLITKREALRTTKMIENAYEHVEWEYEFAKKMKLKFRVVKLIKARKQAWSLLTAAQEYVKMHRQNH